MTQFLGKYVLLFSFLLCLGFHSEAQFFKRKKEKKNKELKTTPLSEKERIKAEELFIEANKHIILNEEDKALQKLKQAYDIDPSNEAILFKLGEFYLKNGNKSEGLKFAEKINLEDSENKYYHLLLVEALKLNNQHERAADVLNNMIRTLPKSESYLYDLADLYKKLNENDKVLKTLEQLEEAFGLNRELVEQKQRIFIKSGKLEKALDEGKKLIEIEPENPRHKISLADLMIDKGREKEAEPLIKEALKQKKDSEYAYLLLFQIFEKENNQDAIDSMALAIAPNEALGIDLKVGILERYRNLLPDEGAKATGLKIGESILQTHPNDAKAYSVFGDFQNFLDNKVEARNYYAKAARLDESHFLIWQQLIRLNYELRAYDSLIVHSDLALELFPNQSLFWYFNGVANYIEKNYEPAKEAFEQGKLLSASDKDLYLQFNAQLGDVYHYLKEYDASNEAYEEVLKAKPNELPVLNNYAYFLSVRGDNLEKALSMSKKLVKEQPLNSTYLDTHGWVLYKMGKYKEAENYLKRAVDNSDSGTILEHYGDVLFQLGEVNKAVNYWKKAAEKEDASDLINKKIEEQKIFE